MKRFAASLFALFALSACDSAPRKPVTLSDIHLQKFSSCDALQKARMASYSPASSEEVEFTANASAGNQDSSRSSLGETNIQVSGVDEIDVAKADGDFIFRVTRDYGASKVQVLRRLPAGSAKVVQSMALDADETATGLFLTPSKVIVLSSENSYYAPYGFAMRSFAETPGLTSEEKIHISYFSRSNDGTLTLQEEQLLLGQVQAARLIGNRMHLVVHQFLGFLYADTEEKELPLPSITRTNAKTTKSLCECIDIWHEPVAEDPSEIEGPVVNSLLGVLTFNVEEPGSDPQGEWIANGYASVVYASKDNLFVASSGWDSLPIHQFQLGDGERTTGYVGSALLKGWLLNQFSMDEHKGHLRVATTIWMENQESQVAVLKLTGGDLELAGGVTGLGKGESIYAVRFMGDVGYVVTFKKVDPLFVLDLADPTNPTVRGALKIPGYSSYLHPMKEGYLLAIGKDAEAAQESDDFAWYQGMAMSIFDVRDLDNPKLVQKIGIGSRGTESEALHDHKAFRYIPEKNFAVIPIDLYEGGSGQWDRGTWTFSGFHIYRTTVEGGFELVGKSSFKNRYGFETWNFSGGGNRSFFKDGEISLIGGGEMVLRSSEKPDVDLARITIE